MPERTGPGFPLDKREFDRLLAVFAETP